MNKSPKTMRLLKVLVTAVLALLVLFVGAVAALWILLPREQIRDAIAAELSKMSQHEVTIDAISFGFHPDLEFVAKSVRIRERMSTEEFISVERLWLDIELKNLLRRRYMPRSVEVESPSVRLVRKKDGHWNAAQLLAALKAGTESRAETAAPERPPVPADIETVRLSKGRVDVNDEASGLHMKIEKMKLTIDIHKDRVDIKSARISLPAMTAEVSGRIMEFTTPERTLAIEADVRVKKDGPLAGVGPAALAAGTEIAKVSLKVNGPPDLVRITSAFSLNEQVTKDISTAGTLAGTLNTTEGVMVVKTFKTNAGAGTVSLHGTGQSLWRPERRYDLEGTAEIPLRETLTDIDANLLTILEPDGFATADLTLWGSMERVDLRAEVDLRPAGVTVPNLMRKEPGAPCSLVASAYCMLPDPMVVDAVTLLLDTAKVQGKAQLNRGREPWLQAEISTTGFPLEMLDRLPSTRFDKGALKFEAEFWQTTTTEKQINYTGRGTITDALMLPEALKDPVEITELEFVLVPQQVDLQADSFVFATSQCRGEAQLTGFKEPRIVGTVWADEVNLDEITAAFARREEAAEESVPEDAEAANEFSVEMQVETESFRAGKLTTGPVSATWKASRNSHVLDPLQGTVWNGEITGRLEFTRGEDETRWTSDFTGTGLQVKDIYAQFLPDERPRATGPMNATGTLSGVTAGTREDVLASLDGSLSVSMTEGEITSHSWLKNIFLAIQFAPTNLLVPGLREVMLLNTAIDAAITRGRSLNPANVQFSRLSGRFDIASGVLHTEDFRLESGIADLMFRGDLDLAKNQMDMRVRTSPLGSVGSLLGKIPIAGDTLKKAKDNAISMEFIVRGPLDNPEVDSAAVEKILETTKLP
jgi:uncharacterized protein involved in outer membrane biogenesis